MGRSKVAQIDEGFRTGLRSTKYVEPDGQGLLEIMGLRASSDGAVLPRYNPLPGTTTVPTTLLYKNIADAGLQISWPFPQFFQGKRTLYMFANTAGGVGRLYTVNTTTWAITQVTPFLHLQNTVDTITFSAFTKPFHCADFWRTMFATNGDVTIFIGVSANYADSAAKAAATSLPWLSIKTLCEHRGSLYLGGLSPNAAWTAAVQADRLNTSTLSILDAASTDKVWKSFTGGGNTLSLIVPSQGYATQEVSDPTFSGTPPAAWTATGTGWTFNTYSGAVFTQTLTGVVYGDLYKVSVDSTFTNSTATIKMSLGAEESITFRAADYGVIAQRVSALLRAPTDSPVLTITCTGTGSATHASVTQAFSNDDDNMRTDTDAIFIPVGDVQQIHPMRDYVIVASTEGVSRIRYYAGIGLGCDVIHETGVKEDARCSVGGSLDKAAAILSNDRLLILEKESQNEADYSWYADFVAMNTTSAVCVYDEEERDIRLSSATYSFLLSDTGLSQVYYPYASSFFINGTMYQMYEPAAPDPSSTFEFISSTIYFGSQTVTQMLGIEISAYEVSNLTATVQIWLPTVGAWIDTAVSTVNPDMFCPICATANRIRIKIDGTADSTEAKINSMRIHYVGNDQRLNRS